MMVLIDSRYKLRGINPSFLMRKLLIPLLATFALPTAFMEEPAKSQTGLICFYSGDVHACYSDITYDYVLEHPNWVVAGSCYQNKPYEVMDISRRDALIWHQTICKGM